MTIYDCFTFFNELDLLEARLDELYGVVDRFVLVESTHTHAGAPKPLHFTINRNRFAKWNDKIVTVVYGDVPAGEGIPATRRREMGQRNAILRGLLDVKDDDLILISDVDEIPRRETIKWLADIPDGMVVTYIQRLYYYNLNTSAPDRPWPGTRAARFRDVKALSPHVIRNGLGQPDPLYPRRGEVRDGGWHFSYFGGLESIRAKQDAFLHQELVNPDSTDEALIQERVKSGTDLWGRTNEQSFVIGPTPDLPWAMRSNPPRWSAFFRDEWRPTFHEDWYDGEQCAYLGWLATLAPKEGAVVEIGCWEGKSTACLAQSLAGRALIAVDTWEGSITEGEDHPTLAALRSGRDVHATFLRNMELLTGGNVQVVKSDWRAWAEGWNAPIAFLHVDGPHDYESVRDMLAVLKPYVVDGGIICGDDLYMSGVFKGTREVLGETVKDIGGRLWVWVNEETPTAS